MGTDLRRATALVLVVVVALVAAGCGQPEGDEDVAVVEDLDLLEGVEAAGTARVATTVEVDVPEDLGAPVSLGFTLETEGVVSFADGSSRTTGTMEVRHQPPEDSVDVPIPRPVEHFEAISTPEGHWSRSWTDDGEPSSWTSIPLPEDDVEDEDEGGDMPAALLGDPSALDPHGFLEELREHAGTVTLVGEEEVRGDPTRRYRASVAAEDVGVLDLDDDGSGRVDVDVWIDDQDRLRRVEAGMVTAEVWDFGAALDVEPPTDVADPEARFDESSLPGAAEVVGEWAPAATGTVGAATWTVFAAPGESQGHETTCRTFEVSGPGIERSPLDALGGAASDMGLPIPNHDGALATCGNGMLGAVLGFVPDPALQVLVDDAAMGSWQSDVPPLVGFALGAAHRTGGLALVLADGQRVELEPDAGGIAVWAADGVAPLEAVELDGGAVRCQVDAAADEDADGSFDGDDVMARGWGWSPHTCRRV